MFAILNELVRRHQQLRHILERAYAQPRWNTRRIDRIADALTETEMRLQRIRQHAVPAPWSGAFRPQNRRHPDPPPRPPGGAQQSLKVPPLGQH